MFFIFDGGGALGGRGIMCGAEGGCGIIPVIRISHREMLFTYKKTHTWGEKSQKINVVRISIRK